MTIFEIDEAIQKCFDSETGEILDFESLDALQMDRAEKIDNTAMLYKDTIYMIQALKDEIKSLESRKKSLENKADGIASYLNYVLESCPYESVKTKISFRPSEAVTISEKAEIPDEYITVKETREPDKKALKEALKRGEEIPGCFLEKRLNPQIK